jgi:activator of HSP90 ATPase
MAKTKEKVPELRITEANQSEMINRFAEIKAFKASIEAEEKLIRDAFVKLGGQTLIDNDEFEVSNELFVVRAIITDTDRFDTKRFKEEHPDQYKAYLKAGTTTTVTCCNRK